MANVAGPSHGEVSIAEIQQFAAFPAGTQRYIRLSLDIGLKRQNAAERWSRNVVEETAIRAQALVYERLDQVRAHIPDGNGGATLELFMAPLIAISAFDLTQGRIESFAAYNFLYERLLGAPTRPWLLSTYCAAASLPHVHPDRRVSLLKAIDERAITATSWPAAEPSFFPQWVDKVDETRPAN